MLLGLCRNFGHRPQTSGKSHLNEQRRQELTIQDWSTFIGPFGRMSWSRLGDDRGRLQVGLQFMLNVAKVDRGAFSVCRPVSFSEDQC